METLSQLADLNISLLSISLMSLRVAVVFMVLPIFSNELIPAVIRNALFITIALVAYVINDRVITTEVSVVDWIVLFTKEILVGIVIGMFFGLYLWAFETAGKIIDSQIGLSMVQIHDPLSGNPTTLIGEFIARFAITLFVISGGLLFLFSIVIKSFSIWPIDVLHPVLDYNNIPYFQSLFSDYFSLALVLAAPLIVICFMIDAVLGLVNRYTPQFNVFFLSVSLKIYGSIFILMILLFKINELIVDNIVTHNELVDKMLTIFTS